MPSGITTPEALEKARSLDIDNMTNGVIPTDDEVREAGLLSAVTGWDKEATLQQRNYRKEELQGSAMSKYLDDFTPAVSDAWERGKITNEQAELMRQYRKTFNENLLTEYEVLETRKQVIPRDDKADDILGKIATYGAESIPLMLDIMKRGAYRGIQGAIAGTAAGALTGPAAPVMVPALALSGFIAAGTGGLAERSAELMGGLYLKELIDEGHTLENAVLMADAVGVIEGIIEVAGMRVPSAFKAIPGVRGLIKKTGVNAFSKSQGAIRKVMTPFIEGSKDVAKEYAEEMAQTIVELSGRKFLDEWDGPAYQEYVADMKSDGLLPIDHNSWSALGIELVNSSGPAFYASVGMITPGVAVQAAATGISGAAEGMAERPPVPTFNTSDEVDAWTQTSATEGDIPALVEKRDANYAMSKRYMSEGDTENALRYGQQGAFYREAIENITGLHGERFKPSKLSVATGYASRMVTGIKNRLGNQGAITVEWPGYNKEQTVIQRQKLLKRRASILKNAGSVNNVGKYLRDKGVPAGIADSVKTYIRSEQEKPFQYSLKKSAIHAKKYQGLDNGSEWYRKIGFEEIIRDETPEEAAKFFAIIGETSRQSDPLINLTKALNIWKAYKAGEPLEEIAKRGGLVPEDEMLSLLKDGKKAIRWTEDLVGQEEGQIKLRDFVQTLELAFKDPALLDTYSESVLDFRMGQYFYNEDPVPGGVRRERGKEQILAIRDYLRKTDDPTFWTTDRVQASLWHWIKDERVKKGLDPDRPQWTFDNAKKRLVGDYYGVDMRDINESYVRGYVKSILTDGEMLIYDHYSKQANIKVLDPTNQGTGRPGREWSRQAVPGEDRPRVIHLYQGKTQAERQFVNDKRYRAIFKAGKLYDFKTDPLGLRKKYAHLVAKADPTEFAKREQEMIDAGYLGFKGGRITVVFDPVRAMRLKGFHLSVSGSFTPEQLADAKANGPDFTVAAMEEIDTLEKEGKEDEVAAKIREYLLKDLGSPVVDVLQANTAEGFWEAEAEKSIATMVEAGDKVVLRGKLAKFLNRFWQYAGVISEYCGVYKATGKRPQGIQREQAPSVVLQFRKDLPYETLVKFNENLNAFGVKGSTYDERHKTLTIHHVKERDWKTKKVAYPVKGIKFTGIIDNAINWSVLPEHNLSQHWFLHTILEKEDYKQYERIGKEREAELGVGKIEDDFFIDPLDLPRHIQERGDINKLAIIETEIDTGKPKEIRGNLLDPELMNLSHGDKVYAISDDYKIYYFDHWAKNHKVVVNDHWQLEGERSILNLQDLTTLKEDLHRFQNAKNKVMEVLTSDRGSIELRKPQGVYEQLKDSKMVDQNGDLIPTFHGTKSDVFDVDDIQPSEGGILGPGIYFTPDPEYANLYAGVGVYPGSRIIPAYLNIKNPYESTSPAGVIGGEVFMNSAEFVQKLKDAGHDGIFFYKPDGTLSEINIFSADQIFPIFEEDIKPTIRKMLLGERGSVELRKKYFKAIAMKDSITGEVFIGNESDIHLTLYGNLPEVAQSHINYDDMGYVDWDGEYYTRREAAEVMGIEQAESHDMRKLGFLERVKEGIVKFGKSRGMLIEKTHVWGPMFTGEIKAEEVETISQFRGKPIRKEHIPKPIRTGEEGFLDFEKGFKRIRFRKRHTAEQIKEGRSQLNQAMRDLDAQDLKDIKKRIKVAVKKLSKKLDVPLEGIKFLQDEFYRFVTELRYAKTTNRARNLRAEIEKTITNRTIKESLLGEMAKTRISGMPKEKRHILDTAFNEGYPDATDFVPEYHSKGADFKSDFTYDDLLAGASIVRPGNYKENIITEPDGSIRLGYLSVTPPERSIKLSSLGQRGAIEFDPSVFRGHGKKAEPWPVKRHVSDPDEIIDLTEIVETKARIRAITGQVKLGTLVTTEATALKQSLQRQATAAREAFIAGKREGIDITTVKLDDLKGKQRERIAGMQEKFQAYKDHVRKMKEMQRVRREVSKIINDMKTVGKKLKTIPDPEKSVLEDFFKEFDLTKLTVKNKLKLQKTKAWLTENQESVELPERVWNSLDRLEKTPIRDLTVDEIRDIGNMVKHVYTLAKMKQKIWVNRKQRDFTEALQTSVKEMRPKLVAAGEALSSLPSRFDKFGKSWEKTKNMLGLYQEHYDLVIESLAGPKSVLYDVLYKTVKRGIIKQLDYKQKAIATLYKTTGREFMQEHGIGNIDKWLKEPVSLGKHTISRDQRMSLYRHFMNDDNRTAILEGGLGFKTSLDPDAVINVTEDEIFRTLAEMPRAELIFAGEAVSNLFEKQGYDLAQVFRERNGYELELVRNYYPKDTMPLGFSSHDFQSKKAVEELTRKVNRIGIEKGMLHHRLGAKLPIYLNGMTEDINNSIHNAGAYIGLELPLSQASRLLTALKQELPQRYGRETYRVIEKGLRDIAGEWQTFTDFERVLMGLKDKATTAILGLNPWVMMKQVMSLPMYWRYVDAEYLIKGSLKSIWNPKETSDRHKLFSPEYMERVEVGYSRDIADIFKPGKRFIAQGVPLKQRLLGGIRFFDKMAVIPGMQGAVDMVLDQMKDGKLSDQVKMALDITDADASKLPVGERIRLAYQYADFATQRTQPMFSPEHRSALSRGGPVEKIMTMFGSATNQFLNMIIRDYRSAVVRKDKDANSKLMQSLFLLLVVNPVGIAALDRMRDWWYDREPDEPFAVDWLKNIAGYVFFLRDVVSYTFNKLQGKHYGFGTPVSMFGDLFGDILSQMSTMVSSDDKAKKAKAAGRFFEKIVQLALLTQGLPYQTPKLLITGTNKKRRKQSP